MNDMSDDVTVSVHEIMQHLRAVGESSCFSLNANGSGALDLDGEPTMRWGIYPEFVHKFRALKLQSAEKRVIAAALAVSVLSHFHCCCDECCELRDAAASFRSLGACHD